MAITFIPEEGPDPFEHLHSDVRHLATADVQTRKAAVLTDHWVSYPAADDAIDQLFEMAEMPPRLRMPSVLFWASPNMGKTHLQKRFLRLWSERAAKWAASGSADVLWLELNDGLTEKRLYIDLLTALGAPAPDTTTPRLQAMVIRHLRARNIRLIILDELQRVTELRPREQRMILNVLKYLSNQLSVGLAGFGSGEAKALIKSDPHLEERFDIVALPAWGSSEKWPVQAVRDRLAFIPLRKPTKVDRALMEKLLFHSEAILGRMFRLVERAAIAAFEHEECLSAELVEAVALRRRRAEDG